MNGRTRALASAAVVTLAVSLAGWSGPASAAGAHHVFVPESFDGSEHFAAGDGPCVPWAGTFHEVRSGGYDIVAAPGGQVPGEVHVNGSVDGLVELVPDDPAMATYAGTYREKVNVVATSASDDGDELRNGQYRLRTHLVGSDGSSYDLVLTGKTTSTATGRVVVARDTFACR